ncbi:MAG: DUF2922 domain-containing protein [Paraclostridium sp.]
MADAKKVIKRLVMTFATQGSGKKISLSIDNPKATLTEVQIKTAMEAVVTNDIFDINGEKIESMVEAKIVVTNTDEYDLA